MNFFTDTGRHLKEQRHDSIASNECKAISEKIVPKQNIAPILLRYAKSELEPHIVPDGAAVCGL